MYSISAHILSSTVADNSAVFFLDYFCKTDEPAELSMSRSSVSQLISNNRLIYGKTITNNINIAIYWVGTSHAKSIDVTVNNTYPIVASSYYSDHAAWWRK